MDQPEDPAPGEDAGIHHLSAGTASPTAGTVSDKEKKIYEMYHPILSTIFIFNLCKSLEFEIYEYSSKNKSTASLLPTNFHMAVTWLFLEI